VVMSISKIAILTFGMAILASSVLISNQAYANIPTTCEGCLVELNQCNDTPDQCLDQFNFCLIANEISECFPPVAVAGLPVPINESEVFGELAQQYSLWLIPSIAAIGIAAFLIKRKL